MFSRIIGEERNSQMLIGSNALQPMKGTVEPMKIQVIVSIEPMKDELEPIKKVIEPMKMRVIVSIELMKDELEPMKALHTIIV